MYLLDMNIIKEKSAYNEFNYLSPFKNYLSFFRQFNRFRNGLFSD